VSNSLASLHHDPVVRVMTSIVLDLYDLLDKVEVRVASLNQQADRTSKRGAWLLSALSARLEKIDEFDGECRFGEGDAGGVSHMLTNLDKFTLWFDDSLELFETAFSELEPKNGSAYYASKIFDLREAFSTMTSRAKRLTPVQVVIQRHFECLKLASPGYGLLDDDELAVLLMELANQRDECFLNPVQGDVTEYLRVAAATAATPEYANHGVKASDGPGESALMAKLEEYTNQLEVFSLLATLEES
jgi:hypothetical protein